MIDAAKAAGVTRFVHTSARGAAPDHCVDFMRTKAAIEAYLRASGLDCVILRPSAIMEWHVHRLLGRATPRSGHFWYVENPRDGADAILYFLAKHPIAPRGSR